MSIDYRTATRKMLELDEQLVSLVEGLGADATDDERAYAEKLRRDIQTRETYLTLPEETQALIASQMNERLRRLDIAEGRA